MEMIRDGKGRGYLAEVNSDNQLEVNAVTEATPGFVSRETQRAFVVASAAITPDGTPNDVFLITNPSSSRVVVLAELDVSCTEGALITIKFDEIYSAGGTGITPVNVNRQSAKPSVMSDSDCYYGNDMTLTGTALTYGIFSLLADTVFRELFYNTVILGYNDSLSVNVNAASGSLYLALKYFELDV